MKAIIGLGNPGAEYEKTRHNCGFLIIDEIKTHFNFPSFYFQKKFDACISVKTNEKAKIILAKPQTFMNSSGKSVGTILSFYNIEPKNIIIVHDDIDILLGKYKISENKNSAGHKGVQSVICELGTKKFKRIRIGIRPENKKFSTDKFVMENFNKDEMLAIKDVAKKLFLVFESIIYNK